MTDKQWRFASEYIVDLNATAAAIRAGYKEKTAGQIGHNLLQNPDVQGVIKKMMDARQERTELAQDRIIDELKAIAFADVSGLTPVANRAGLVDYVPTERWTEEQRAAVSGVEVTAFGTRVKTYDKLKALELLMKHTGMLNGGGGEDDGKVTIVDDI